MLIRELRVNQGRTLADVAQAANISEGTLSMIERGLSRPTAPVAFRILGALGSDLQVTDVWPLDTDSPAAA